MERQLLIVNIVLLIAVVLVYGSIYFLFEPTGAAIHRVSMVSDAKFSEPPALSSRRTDIGDKESESKREEVERKSESTSTSSPFSDEEFKDWKYSGSSHRRSRSSSHSSSATTTPEAATTQSVVSSDTSLQSSSSNVITESGTASFQPSVIPNPLSFQKAESGTLIHKDLTSTMSKAPEQTVEVIVNTDNKDAIKQKGIGMITGESTKIVVVELPASQVDDLVAGTGAKFVEPNKQMFFQLNESRVLIGVPDMEDAGYGGFGNGNLKIAVVDSGIDLGHEMFTTVTGKINATQDFAGTGTIEDTVNHGSRVAGVAGGAPPLSVSYVGMAQSSRLLIAKVADQFGGVDTADVIEAFDWAIANNASVITMSIGSTSRSDSLLEAIQRARNAGIIVVVSAGNCGPGCPNTGFCGDYRGVLWPAAAPEVIAVGATDKQDNLWCGSGQGPIEGVIKPDIVAPGVDVTTSSAGGSYTSSTGTSFSTPHVAGALALLKDKLPSLTPDQARRALEYTSNDLGSLGKDNLYGWGRINVSRFTKLDLDELVGYNITYSTSVRAGQSQSVTITLDAARANTDVRGKIKKPDGSFGNVVVFNTANNKDYTATMSDTSQVGVNMLDLNLTPGDFPIYVRREFNVTVNNAPTLAAISDITVNEGALVSVTLVPSDIDGDTLTTSLNDTRFTKNGNLFTWQTGFVDAGVYSIKASVSDGTLLGFQTFHVTVSNVNRAPVLTQPTNITVNESSLVSVTLAANDPDNDALVFNVNGTTFTKNSNILTWQTGFDDAFADGSAKIYYFGVNVTDGQLFDSKKFRVSVTKGNRAPTFTSSAVTSAQVAVAYSYDANAQDPDGDAITYSLAQAQTGMTINSGTGVLSWTPGSGQTGSQSVIVRATDGGNAFGDQSFSILVGTQANRAPVLTQPSDVSVNEGQTVSVTLSATDPDGNTLIYSFNDTRFSNSNTVFTWVTGFNDAGVYSLNASVSDGSLRDAKIFRVTVINLNRLPSFSSTPLTAGTVGVAYSYDADASDPDGSTLVYSLSTSPVGMTINSQTGMIGWIPSAGQTGSNSVVVRVSDGVGTQDQSFTISVGTQPNHAPVLTQPANLVVNEGQTVAFTLNATDADGDVLTYSVNDTHFSKNVNQFSWLTGFSDARVYSVRASASDASSADSKVFSLTVNNVNRKPSFTSSPLTTGTVGVAYSYDANAQDPDGDTVVFSLLNPPLGMSINSQTGVVSWVPSGSQVGANSVTVRATDGILVESQSFTLTVSTTANAAPQITTTPPLSTSALVSYTYNVDATDADGDSLVFSLISSPSGMIINSASGLISWTPTASQRGNHEVIVAVNDTKKAETRQSFTLTVNGCTEDWTCTAFGDCVNGLQTRTCTDRNNCGTTVQKPSESQSCANDCSSQNNNCQNFCDGPHYYSSGSCVNSTCRYAQTEIDSSNCVLTRDVQLSRGINLVSVPVRDSTLTTASALASRVGSGFVARVVDGKFQAFIPGLSPDFSLEPSVGYLVNSPQNVLLTMSGLPYSQVSYNFPQGLNIVSLPLNAVQFSSSDDVARIFNASFVVKATYDASLQKNLFYMRHPASGQGSVFAVSPFEAYILYLKQPFSTTISNANFENKMKEAPYPGFEKADPAQLDELRKMGAEIQ